MNRCDLALKIITVLLIVAFLSVDDLAAKKPIKNPPPGSEDSCAGQTVFSPDFAFWRKSGGRKALQVTIFLAESGTGCEKPLSSFTASGYTTELRYSNHLNNSGQVDHGRVVWMDVIGDSWEGATIWMQEFGISGMEIVDRSPPRRILHSSTLDDPDAVEYVHDVDMSPDMNTLAMTYRYHRDSNDDESYSSIRVVDIAQCLGGCTFGDAPALEVGRDSSSNPGSHVTLSWGPMGDRIYTKHHVAGGGPKSIQFFDLVRDSDGHWKSLGRGNLFSSQDYPEMPWMRAMSQPFSGVRGPKGEEREFLAVEAEPGTNNESCENIYVIDVDGCWNDPVKCAVEPEFVGALPSWTRNGEIIHRYEGWTLRGKCDFKKVGAWNGNDLIPVLEGDHPDGASGLPW